MLKVGGEVDDDLQDDKDPDASDESSLELTAIFGPHAWPIWLLIMLVSFWALAVIVEEFFVPALNVMCVCWKIPDDVAGATFMAAGASSPELFAALISLFVTRSALGIGTIIGSEIFNHLCITAGSILYSKGGVLEVDARILARDIVFYFIAILALLYCESDVRQCDSGAGKFVDCDDQWDDEVS